MSERDRPARRTWLEKFRDAFRGLWIGVRGQSSFAVHLPAAALVIGAGALLKVTLLEWCLLVFCITLVFSAEMFNSALESMAKAIDVEHNLHLADGLDVGSAAVLVAAIGSAVIGTIVFVPRLLEFF